MHERTNSDIPGAGHPDLEELAALIDGKLSAEEAASLRSHLAHCEPCLALFAETASFLAADEADAADEVEVAQPEAPLLPFKPPGEPRTAEPNRRRTAAYTKTAAALAALALGIMVYRQFSSGPPRADVARLVASLVGDQAAVAAIAGKTWQTQSSRGSSRGPDDHALASFRLGVELADLEVGLGTGQRAPAQASASRIVGLLAGTSEAASTRDFFRDLPARITPTAPLAPIAEETTRQREALEGYLEPTHYDLGRWAEAGRLAAVAARPEFLTSRNTRRLAHAFRQRLDHEPTPEPRAGLDALDAIAATLDRGDLTARDYAALEAHFREILAAYYPA